MPTYKLASLWIMTKRVLYAQNSNRDIVCLSGNIVAIYPSFSPASLMSISLTHNIGGIVHVKDWDKLVQLSQRTKKDLEQWLGHCCDLLE